MAFEPDLIKHRKVTNFQNSFKYLPHFVCSSFARDLCGQEVHIPAPPALMKLLGH